MKNAFVVSHLVIGAGYLAALVLAQAGILSAGAVSLPVFIVIYVAAGLLGLALHDYGRTRVLSIRRTARRVPATARKAAPVSVAPASTWGYRTLSA